MLIPQWREPDEVLKPLLDSIGNQRGINMDDIGVIITNDGTDVFLSNELLKSYPYEIQYFKEPHKGVSAARNHCLDKATADYVMFCDDDDVFFNSLGIWMIFQEMDVGEFDTLNSTFVEEYYSERMDGLAYSIHENDTTFVHGKVHRRQYLIDKGIRWDEKLEYHQDSHFNIRCLSYTENKRYCKNPFYMWVCRKGSECRKDPTYMQRTYEEYINSSDSLVTELLNNGYVDLARSYMASMMFTVYYDLNSPEWFDDSNKGFREGTEKRYAQYYIKYKTYWDSVSNEDRAIISQKVREDSMKNEGMLLEHYTFDNWIQHIEEIAKTL